MAWYSKYGSSTSNTATAPNSGGQTSWLSKYAVPTPKPVQSTQSAQPTSGYTVIGGKSYPTASLVQPQQPNFFQQAGNFLGNLTKPTNEGLGATVGRLLQKVPDTTVKMPINAPVVGLNLGGSKISEFLTSIPGAFANSWGKSLETLSTPEGKKKLKEDTKRLPQTIQEVKDHLSKKEWGQAMQTAFDNSAISVGLDVSDFIPVGFIAKIGLKGLKFRKTGQQIVKEGVEEAGFKTVKEVFEPVKVPEVKVETPKAKPLQPLAEEARKYKSAEEFINGQYDATSVSNSPEMIKFGTELSNDIKKVDRFEFLKTLPVDKNGNFTVDPNNEITKMLTNFNKKYGTKITKDDFIKGNIPNRNDIYYEKYKSQLTDIYTQATGGLEGGGGIKGLAEEAGRFIPPKDLERGIHAPRRIKMPIAELTQSNQVMGRTFADIRRGETSKSKGAIDVWYDINRKQYLITDGNHRVAEALKRGEKTIDVNLTSGTFNDQYAPVPKGEEYLFREHSAIKGTTPAPSPSGLEGGGGIVNKAIAEYKKNPGSPVIGGKTNGEILFETLNKNPDIAKEISEKSISKLKSDGVKYLYREGSENGMSWSTKPELTEKFKAYSYGMGPTKKIALTDDVLERVAYYDNANIGKFDNMHESEVILRPKFPSGLEGGVKVEPKVEPIGEGVTKASKLGLRVEQTAIEKKLTDELTDLPEYKQLNMKEQAKKASDLLNTDPDKAMRIALGEELPPEGLLKESVFKALEGSITTPEMAAKLANSPLVSEATALGQKIKALDVKVSDSPVEAIRQVIDARAKALEKRLGRKPDIEKTTKDIKSKVKVPDKYDWGKFLEEIKC